MSIIPPYLQAFAFKFQLPRKWGIGALLAYGVFLVVIVVQYEFMPPRLHYFDQW